MIIHFFQKDLKHRPSALSEETLAFDLTLTQVKIALRSCVWHIPGTRSPCFEPQSLPRLLWSLQMSYLVLKSSAASLALSIFTTSLAFSDLPHRICRGSIVAWVMLLFSPSCSVSFQTIASGPQACDSFSEPSRENLRYVAWISESKSAIWMSLLLHPQPVGTVMTSGASSSVPVLGRTERTG